MLLAALACSWRGAPEPVGPSTRWHRAETTVPPSLPETDEERAQRVLGTLNEYCAGHQAACLATFESEAPPVQVPDHEWRSIRNQQQELRSLGFIVRWDPGTGRAEIHRGNTPTFRGDIQSDP